MILANRGWPVLKIPDGVTYDTTTEEQRRRSGWAYFLFACDGKPNPPEAPTKKTEPGYTGEHRATFAAGIRRRRAD